MIHTICIIIIKDNNEYNTHQQYQTCYLRILFAKNPKTLKQKPKPKTLKQITKNIVLLNILIGFNEECIWQY